MRILLATAHPYLPELTGGAQSSMHELALGLIEQGHEVAVLAGFMGAGASGLLSRVRLRIGSSPLIGTSFGGYPVFRGWRAWEGVEAVRRAFMPNVVSPQSGSPVRVSRAFRKIGVPSAIYFRNVEEDDFGGAVEGSANAYIANSEFTAEWLRRKHGLTATTILPMFEADRYRTATSRRYVTFINPHPSKGRDIAFALAEACPDIEFLIVRAWNLGKADEAALQHAVSACPNITLRESTQDMRSIYADTRLVLAPSQWEEAFGRIAAEGHLSGIPVLASDIGGLPEAVGPGGRLVAADAPIETWARTLRDMLDDPARYAAMCDAAVEYSLRPALQKRQQVLAFVGVCQAAIAAHGAHGAQA